MESPTRIPQAQHIFAHINALYGCHAETPEQTLNNLLQDLTIASWSFAERSEPELVSDVTPLWSPDIASPNRRKVATAVLLHLLAGAEAELDRIGVTTKIIKFLDSEVSDSLYSRLGINTRTQPHKKLGELVEVVPSLQDSLRSIPQSLNTKNEIPNVRQKYLKELNAQKAKVALLPLLPPELHHEPIQHLFTYALNFLEAKQREFYTAYEAFRKQADRLSGTAGELGPPWGEIFCTLIDQLASIIDAVQAADPRGRPANIHVDLTPKRYPLAERGTTFDLRVVTRNEADGEASDLCLRIEDADGIALETSSHELGTVAGYESRYVSFPATTTTDNGGASIAVVVEWTDGSGERRRVEDVMELPAQTRSIYWEEYEYRTVYSLEPVQDAKELIGRDDVLKKLVPQFLTDSVGNAIIKGQKRVGKTSITNAALQKTKANSNRIIAIQLSAGQFVRAGPQETEEALCTEVIRMLRRSERRLSTIEHLEVENSALSPIDSFCRSAQYVAPEQRIIIAIDEFDEIPQELYRVGARGEAFFQGLRSLSSLANVGLLLVGGEKVDYILDKQGQALNKFDLVHVDYFGREDWWDFSSFVRRPAEGVLEFSDDAINRLYYVTAGHPYYAKLLSATVWQQAREARDGHVTEREVDRAVDRAVKTSGINMFQHFWDDGVPETVDAQETRLRRKTLLVSLGELLSRSDNVSIESIGHGAGLGYPEAHEELRDLVRRGVLVGDDEALEPRVPLFGWWLAGPGRNLLITRETDLISRQAWKREKLRLQVTDEEIEELIGRWGLFRGQRIGRRDVREWLSQFADDYEQRLMFKLLRNVQFYDQGQSRLKFREAFNLARRNVVQKLVSGQRKRREFVVSCFGGVGKSGSWCARLFAEENNILVDLIKEPRAVADVCDESSEIQVAVFVDDFVGTGGQLKDFAKDGVEAGLGALDEAGIQGYFFAVTGFQEAAERGAASFEEEGLPIECHICDPMGPESRAFDEQSGIFESPEERDEARAMAMHYGKQLVPDAPLGYGDCESLVVFEQGVPNATLPIFWSEKNEWPALFPRR